MFVCLFGLGAANGIQSCPVRKLIYPVWLSPNPNEVWFKRPRKLSLGFNNLGKCWVIFFKNYIFWNQGKAMRKWAVAWIFCQSFKSFYRCILRGHQEVVKNFHQISPYSCSVIIGPHFFQYILPTGPKSAHVSYFIR